ncbi:MAG: hypothetical protein J0M01_12620 [Dechloromonas sp.]|nr:hypothetical protein [Dechloromonas sp.]
MELTFTIDGREALPVRAIPWVAGAEIFTHKLVLPPSLIVLSARTACDSKDVDPGAPLLRFYRYDRGRVQPVTAERLHATAPECDFQPEADEPLRESTRRLPAGMFVFLDELRSFVDWIYAPGTHDGECRDAVALNTSPDVPAEMIEWLQEGCVAPEPNSAGNRLSHRKIVFWLAQNEILIPADQVPGAIADALYPRPDRNGGIELNDTDTVPRLLAEREHAKMLRMKFPHLKDGDKFSIGDLNDYLARLGMAAELRHRRDVLDSLNPENRCSRRQFEDAFNAVREPVAGAQRSASELSAERCTELAKLPELFVHHWEELTGIGICKGGAYTVSQSGVYPEQYSDDDLRSLFPEERRVLLERATRPPLGFPCTPSQLLKFVDGGLQGEFEVPDDFRAIVEPHWQLSQKDSEQSVSSGAPESAEPPLFSKQEILAVDWPMPLRAPSLENILNERPKWVSEACVPVGKPGGGAGGSHLWKPAVLAACLATTTPQKRWHCNKTALTNFLRLSFPDNIAQWEGLAENL